jgi:hypothetical protein
VTQPRAATASGRLSAGTFSYSGDPSASDVDAVRFLIGDVDASAFFLSDAEINFTLLEYFDHSWNRPNLLAAAGACAESIAAQLSREVSYSADGVSVSGDTLAAKYFTVAEKIRTLGLRTNIVAGPDFGYDGLLFADGYDPGLRPLVFGVGMHDNFRAGRQDGLWFPAIGYWAFDYYPFLWDPIAAYTAEIATTTRRSLAFNVHDPTPQSRLTALPQNTLPVRARAGTIPS